MQETQETQVRSLGREDPLLGRATHSSILARRILWTGEIGGVKKSQIGLSDLARTHG